MGRTQRKPQHTKLKNQHGIKYLIRVAIFNTFKNKKKGQVVKTGQGTRSILNDIRDNYSILKICYVGVTLFCGTKYV